MCDPASAIGAASSVFSAIQGMQAAAAQKAHQRRQAQANVNAAFATRQNEIAGIRLDSLATQREARVTALEASIASAEVRSQARTEFVGEEDSGRLNHILTGYNIAEGSYREKIGVELDKSATNAEYRDQVSRANFEARKAGAQNLAKAPVQNVDFGAILSGIGGAFAARQSA